jgi:hypothetical protein
MLEQEEIKTEDKIVFYFTKSLAEHLRSSGGDLDCVIQAGLQWINRKRVEHIM